MFCAGILHGLKYHVVLAVIGPRDALNGKQSGKNGLTSGI